MTERIYAEIEAKRVEMDPLWGTYEPRDAIDVIDFDVTDLIDAEEGHAMRQTLVNIAALAVAGIIAADRRAAEEGS